MRFGIDEQQKVINHLVLAQDRDTTLENIKNSKLWKEEKIFEMKILINDVPIEYVEQFEEFLKHQYDCIETTLRKEYDADSFDMKVKEAAEKLIKDKFGDLQDKMYQFERMLDFFNDEE